MKDRTPKSQVGKFADKNKLDTPKPTKNAKEKSREVETTPPTCPMEPYFEQS